MNTHKRGDVAYERGFRLVTELDNIMCLTYRLKSTIYHKKSKIKVEALL